MENEKQIIEPLKIRRVSISQKHYNTLEKIAKTKDTDNKSAIESIIDFYAKYMQTIERTNGSTMEYIAKNPNILESKESLTLLKTYAVAKALEEEKKFVKCVKECSKKIMEGENDE